MNKNYLCNYDFETSSASPLTTQILQIGAAIIDPLSLKIVDEFNSLAKYENWDEVQPKALAVNNLTKEMLDNAPDIKIVFKDFVTFVQKYKISGNSMWGNPIPCGQNIGNFDSIILDRYCQRFKVWNPKEERNKLFHPFLSLDTACLFFSWFENEKEPRTLGQVSIANYLGISQDEVNKSHDAIEDVRINSKILIRFLQFQRNIMGQYRDKIKGCFLPKE
jgi:inhibitor of KinA sporulation pathway (predicted exonuclease)